MIKEGEYITKKDIADSVFPKNTDPTNQLIINTNNKEELLHELLMEDFK